MTLHKILRRVLRKLDHDDYVTIAQQHRPTYQYRFSATPGLDRGYRVDGCRWLDGTESPSFRGTPLGYVGWSLWSTSFGFSPEAVLAEDWYFVEEKS